MTSAGTGTTSRRSAFCGESFLDRAKMARMRLDRERRGAASGGATLPADRANDVGGLAASTMAPALLVFSSLRQEVTMVTGTASSSTRVDLRLHEHATVAHLEVGCGGR